MGQQGKLSLNDELHLLALFLPYRIRVEKLFGESHRPDIDANGLGNSRLAPPDEFRTSAADVDNQQFPPVERKSPLNRQKRIGSLLVARYDANVQPQLLLKSAQHFRTILGISQRARTHRYDFFDKKILTPVQITSQHLESSLFCFRANAAGPLNTFP